MQYVIEQFAVTVSAITGVLAARGKQVDLFGVIVLALVTAFGGGTIRDLALGCQPVFWVSDPNYLVNATATAVVCFIVARFHHFPQTTLLVADAFALALFTIAGTKKAVMLPAAPSIAIAMGVITGVAGGIFRDVLTGEIPLVFKKEIYLYATASFCGALVYVVVWTHWPSEPAASLIGLGITLALRLAAIRWKLGLPVFKSKN